MAQKTESYLVSSNKVNKLHVVTWTPDDGDVRGIVQISHGMCEYIDRYDRFASFLADKGFVVTGNDHLGHGKSVPDDSELGYMNAPRGAATLVDDLFLVTADIRSRYPQKPFFLLGHSMGSFLARQYMMTYGGMVTGAVIMGTGSQPAGTLKTAQRLANIIGRMKGEKHKSKLLNTLSFASYNKKIKNVRTNFDWLSRNTENVDRYLADPHCGFPFTVSGFKVLFGTIAYIQDPDNIRKLPKNVPLYFVSGKEDPVGHYGEDVKAVAASYRDAGVRSIRVKLYAKCRHEILNEDAHDRVDADILAFFENHM